jgi:asparagine synthase (glutamine-hydrolysing)
MCGICGYLHFDKSKKPSETILRSMMSTLAKRGPDDEGTYIKDNVALGHRRLSIIDLETGRQPITNEDGSLIIIYNGEVYNFPELKSCLEKKGHLFKTHSDTEVVVHAYEEYGEDCLKYFNGMFSLAVWDAKKQLLFLARDRFGKKPLYYAVFDSQFIFGSELKALLKHPSVKREIDKSALSKYLAYEYVPSPYSIFKNIYKLEAGSKLVLKDAGYKTSRWWKMDFDKAGPFDLKAAEEELLGRLKESVRKRLISDVPLGVFLSGGIDSSAVVSMMAALMDPGDIKTFSVGFREEAFDESDDARRVAEYFGTDHRQEILRPDAMLEVLPEILGILDEPFADSSIIPTYIISRFTRQFVKVALGGDGGDELFSGYPSFRAHRLERVLSFLPGAAKRLPLKVLASMSPVSYDSPGIGLKAKRFLRGLDFPPNARHQAWIGTFTPYEQRSLFLPERLQESDLAGVYGPTEKFFEEAASLEPMDKVMYIYLKTYMSDDILAKVDRASMANSLEVRAPFLDTDFAAFAANIPASYKLKGRVSKWILKDALKNKLPGQTLRKGKQGFAVPVAKWLRGDLRALLEKAFDKRKIEKEGIFDYNYIKALLDDFLLGRRDLRKEIWALFMFECWYDRWANSDPDLFHSGSV